MTQRLLEERIFVDLKICGGKPCIKGTRVPVHIVLEALATGMNFEEVKKEFGVWPQGMEGQEEGRWVVIDYGSLIVHSFYDFVRHEYRLEELWKNGKEVPL